MPYLGQPQLAQEACASVVELAHHKELRVPHEAEFDKALDIVIRTSKDPTWSIMRGVTRKVGREAEPNGEWSLNVRPIVAFRSAKVAHSFAERKATIGM